MVNSTIAILHAHRYRLIILFAPMFCLLVLGGFVLVHRSESHLLRTIKTPSHVSSLTFSPNGRLLATGNLQGQIVLWNVTSGSPIQTLTGHTGRIMDLVFSPDSQWLVSGGSDGTVRLWQTASGRHIRILVERHADPNHASYFVDQDGTKHLNDIQFHSVSFSPNGSMVAVGSDEGWITIVQPTTGQILQNIQWSPFRTVLRVAFSPDGRQLAVGERDGSVQLWQVDNGHLIERFTGSGTSAAVYGLAFDPTGTSISVGTQTAEVQVWSTKDAHLLVSAEALPSSVQSVALVVSSGFRDDQVY